VALSSDQASRTSSHRKTSLSVKSLSPMLPTPYPHHSIPPLKAKQYSKLTNTPTNAEYYVPKNSPSIKHSCLSTRCPSKSKIRNILNLRCPKCPSHSNRHFGHPPTKSHESRSPQMFKNMNNPRPFNSLKGPCVLIKHALQLMRRCKQQNSTLVANPQSC
jgi:hypothetical protein